MAVPFDNGRLPLALSGRFKPWAIEVGHSKLLLRGLDGDPEEDDPLRVYDVLFQDVSRISLADSYRGIELSVADPGVVRDEEQRIGTDWPRSRMFLVGHRGSADYVVAGFAFWAEVLVGGWAPSPLLSEELSADQIRGSVYRL